MAVSSWTCDGWYGKHFFCEVAYDYITVVDGSFVDETEESAMCHSFCGANFVFHVGVCEEFGIGEVFEGVVFELLHRDCLG